MASSVKKICWTVLFVVTALIPPASWAHAHLTHQYPAADAEVTAAPQALTLNFSEGIEPGFSGATLTGPQQEVIKLRPAKRNEQDKSQLIVPLDESLKPGKYTVDWHVVSVDGHKTKGHYTFSVK